MDFQMTGNEQGHALINSKVKSNKKPIRIRNAALNIYSELLNIRQPRRRLI